MSIVSCHSYASCLNVFNIAAEASPCMQSHATALDTPPTLLAKIPNTGRKIPGRSWVALPNKNTSGLFLYFGISREQPSRIRHGSLNCGSLYGLGMSWPCLSLFLYLKRANGVPVIRREGAHDVVP